MYFGWIGGKGQPRARATNQLNPGRRLKSRLLITIELFDNGDYSRDHAACPFLQQASRDFVRITAVLFRQRQRRLRMSAKLPANEDRLQISRAAVETARPLQ